MAGKAHAGKPPEGLPTKEEFEELEKQFVAATNFAEFWDMYLENFVTRSGYLDMGTPSYAPQLVEIASVITGKILGREVKLPSDTRFRRIEMAGIVHGSYPFEGHFSSVLFFEKAEKGLFVFVRPNGKHELARFKFGGQTVVANLPKKDPSSN